MNMDYQAGDAHQEKLDADAVCIQCGTVNAEGTLLCKVCGNNLRDQRVRRLASDQALESAGAGPRRRVWASAVFFVLAVALIISTLFNQEMIVSWLMDVQAGTRLGPSDLWNGAPSTSLNELAESLESTFPTEELALQARDTPSPGTSMSGMYAVFSGEQFVGAANIRETGNTLHLVAVLNGGEQLRGLATLQGDYYVMVPESGGLDSGRRIIAIQGVASPVAGGVVECVGDDSRSRYSCMAYRLPS